MPNSINHPLQECHIELLKKSPINDSFPIVFKGGFTYTSLSAFCADCDQVIEDNNLRGEVRAILPNMTQVEACGHCIPCNKVTPISYRLYSDGRFMGIRNGKWTTWQMKSDVPWWKKVLKFLFY